MKLFFKTLLFVCFFLFVFCLSASAASNIIQLPRALTVVQKEAFYGSTSLYQVLLHNGITEIQDRAFAGTDPYSVEIPASVTKIADNAFEGCSRTQFYVVSGSYAEEYCQKHNFNYVSASNADFTYTAIDDKTCSITGYSGKMLDVIVPSEIDGLKVTRISSLRNSFGRSGIVNLTIPEGVEHFGALCDFMESKPLEHISLPESLKSIGEHAFQNCKNLTEITLPDNVSSIAKGAFFHCENLQTISLPANLQTIEDSAFAYCYTLTDIHLPEGLTSIKADAFYRCKLGRLEIPKSLTSIGPSFHDAGITELIIPEGVTRIGNRAFEGNPFKELNLPSTIKKLGSYAFANCKFETLILPDGLISIDDHCFFKCKKLSLIYIPPSVTEMDVGIFRYVENAFLMAERDTTALEYVLDQGLVNVLFILEPNPESDFTYTKLSSTTCAITGYKGTWKDVVIPEKIKGLTVKQIAANAFKGKKNITSVTCFNEITSIKGNAFSGCTKLVRFQMTDKVKSIADTAFNGCNELWDINVVSFQ